MFYTFDYIFSLANKLMISVNMFGLLGLSRKGHSVLVVYTSVLIVLSVSGQNMNIISF